MDSEDLVNLLKRLSGKEQQVLILRFGIGLPEGLTLDEIGKKYNVTRERIRQIESKALSKLRKNNHGLIESYFGKSK